MERDDVIEYSLYNHHSAEEGVKKRKTIWNIFWLLLVVTVVEITLGFIFSRDESMKTFLLWTFVILTLVKAYYIIMSYMHLGDEKKSFSYSILIPFFLFVTYLLVITLIEGSYSYEMLKFF